MSDDLVRLYRQGRSTLSVALELGWSYTRTLEMAESLELIPPVRRGQRWKHGASAYANGKCKCEVCTREHRTRTSRRRKERYKDRPKDPQDPRHGTQPFYTNHGCRCAACTKAHSQKCKEYMARRKEREGAA